MPTHSTIRIDGSGEKFQWDITGIRVNHCNIIECRFGIYINTQNCDFIKITDSRVGAITGGFGIYLEKVGIISIDSVLGAGPVTDVPELKADTYIHITAAHGTLSISGCECEGYNNAIQVVPINVGNHSWPILLLNCSFGPTIQLSSQCEIVSVANKYLPDTVQCNPSIEAMIYSFGDSMVDVNKHPDPTYDFNLNDSDSRLVSRANRFRVDFQRPARFGGQAGEIAPWLEHTALAISPFTPGHAQMALCDDLGAVLFHVRADSDFIYFEDPRLNPTRRLMKMDRDGNLTVRGNVNPNTNP